MPGVYDMDRCHVFFTSREVEDLVWEPNNSPSGKVFGGIKIIPRNARRVSAQTETVLSGYQL